MATTDSVARIIALSAMGGGGVSEVDYSKATNKPRINGNELVGDKTSTDLGLASIEAISNVVYEPSTGIMTFEKENGTSFNIDLPLELLIKSGSYDATTKEILLELANGDVIRINVGDLVDTYFGDEETIELFQEGGENKFRVKETVLTKIYDELNKRLKYKGHVNSKEDLPTAGQVSGEAIEPNAILYSDIYTSPNQYTKQNALSGRDTTYRYYVAAGSGWDPRTDSDAWYSGCINTNYEDIIDGICFGEYPAVTGQSKKSIIFVHVNASSTKPCWVKGREAVYVYDEQGTETRVYSNNLITYPCWVNIQGTRSPGCLYGNITNPLKLKYWDIASVGSIQNINNKTITRADFLYNPGYKMFKFDLAGDENAVTVTTTPSDINENDVYTVGPNYDLVRGNAVEQKWEQLAPKSIEIDNNTIALSSENKIQTRAIIDKNTNNANSFWTGTKAEYDALGVYDENTFYAIIDEASEMQSALTEVSGYDAAKTQILKNINGTLTWVDSQ